jgi:glycosyltransferase involved in cell wall biosynthesis
MNILLATSFFPPARNAGTEKRTLGYAKALLERGHQVQVLCVGNFEEGASHYWNGHTDEIYQGIPVRRIQLFWQKSPDPNSYLYKNPETAQFFHKCLEEWQPDLVHITSCLTLSASIIGVAKESGLPVVLTLTDFWFLCHKLSLLKYDGSLCDGITTSRECVQCLSWESGIYQKLKRISSDATATQILDGLSKIPAVSRMRVLRGMTPNISDRKVYLAKMLNIADVVIAPSSHLRDIMQHSGITGEIKVIQSGHDLSGFIGKTKKLSSDHVRIGYIGQIIFTKGVHVLLTAFGSCDWQGKAELHLFGNTGIEPAYWQELQKIENSNAGSIFFHEPFPHEKLGEIMAGLDVLVIPSLWYENNPRVIQEAFASKLPVIASDVGGISEYVQHGVNGYLFRRGDSEDLRVQIQHIVDDPARIQQLGANLPAVKTIHDEMDEIEALYRDLLFRLDAGEP